MLERSEVERSLTGAWALFLDRGDALQWFDFSVDGFWRSFRAIILVIPAYFAFVVAEPIMATAVTDEAPSPNLAAGAVALVLEWIALPIVLAVIAGQLGIAARYGAFIVARNWASVVAIAPTGVVAVLLLLGLIGPVATNFLMFIILLVMLRYSYIVARRTLEIGPGFAVGIVALDVGLSLTISSGIDLLFG
ncbi:hypothetical protein [Bauldia sp.]|uniref:hypothetical protein n=1 Tax=Bauldia sp. TaxID=2575872 RepID=UPI003BABF74C